MKAQELHRLMVVNEFNTATYFAILELIRNGDQKLVVIKQKLGLTDSAVCALIDRLVQRGLLTRVMNPVNKREKLSELTPKGFEALQQFYDLFTRTDTN